MHLFSTLKENVRNFYKTVELLLIRLYLVRELFFLSENLFWGKREFYLFYYNAILEDCVLFKKTQSIIEIDVIVVKNICLFKFRWKVCKITVKKKKVNVIIIIITTIIICLNVPIQTGFWISLGSWISKVLNMAGFSLCERYTAFCICQNILNMQGFLT